MESETTFARPRAFDPGQFADRHPPARPPGWDLGPERRIDDGRTLARALAWFSIGLGAAQLAAPERFTRLLGVDREHARLVRLYGLREIASGGALLAQRDPILGIWSRIGGDLIDLATLGAALGGSRRKGGVAAALALVAGAAALDVLCARQLQRHERG
jgi:hypothetical protein